MLSAILPNNLLSEIKLRKQSTRVFAASFSRSHPGDADLRIVCMKAIIP